MTVEYSDTISDTMLGVPRQAVLLAGDAAFGSTDRMASTPLDTPCIETPRWRNRKGYAIVQRDNKRWFAHRLAWTDAHGPIPPGMLVCHRCDNPPCANVEHLFLGTAADNAADCKSKGRTATGAANGTITRPDRVVRGVRKPMAKLTDESVVALRLDAAAGMTLEELGEKYQVSSQTAGKALSGRTWRHVGGPIRPPRPTHGENARQAILTDAKVIQLRADYAAGAGGNAVAAKYGVSRGTVYAIVRGRRWRHLLSGEVAA